MSGHHHKLHQPPNAPYSVEQPIEHPVAHSTSHPILRVSGVRSRRAFLGDLGGGAVALALLSPVIVVSCGSGDDAGSGEGNGGTAHEHSPALP